MIDSKVINSRNIMLVTVSVLILLSALITIGMLTPLIIKLMTGVEITMDMQYFNNRTAPIAAVLAILLAMCMLIGHATSRTISVIAGVTLSISILSLIISPFKCTPIDVMVPIIIPAIAITLYRIYRALDRDSTLRSLRGVSVHLIHLGILLLIIGTVLSTNLKVEDSEILYTGTEHSFEGQHYSLKVVDMDSGYEGIPYRNYPGSSYATTIDIEVYRRGEYFDSAQVKYITDFKWGQTYTTTYIKRGVFEELFIAPRTLDESTGRVDMYVRTVPFINLVWGGMWMMVISILMFGIVEYVKEGRELDKITCHKDVS
ncbi:MAG: hypothetical protein K8R64_06450 [Methanosarcinaceae archaeon]|nr:hypothetical protein [Methanosarcinaceae archaeon]